MLACKGEGGGATKANKFSGPPDDYNTMIYDESLDNDYYCAAADDDLDDDAAAASVVEQQTRSSYA